MESGSRWSIGRCDGLWWGCVRVGRFGVVWPLHVCTRSAALEHRVHSTVEQPHVRASNGAVLSPRTLRNAAANAACGGDQDRLVFYTEIREQL